MTPDQSIFLLSEMIWNALYIALPIMLASVLAGVALLDPPYRCEASRLDRKLAL